MAVLENFKDCSTCDKVSVCKYHESREKLYKRLKDSVSNFGDGEVLYVTLRCNEHKSNIQTR